MLRFPELILKVRLPVERGLERCASAQAARDIDATVRFVATRSTSSGSKRLPAQVHSVMIGDGVHDRA
jgi:hypothetical protein